MRMDASHAGLPLPFRGDEPVALPAAARTKCGQVFDPRADLWVVRKHADGGNTLHFDWTKLAGFSREAVGLAKRILADRAPSYAGTTTWNDFYMLMRFAAWLPGYAARAGTRELLPFRWRALDTPGFAAFLDHGLSTAQKGNDFARLRDLYRWGVDALRHPSFAPDVLVAIEGTRAPGNSKGQAVRAGDATKGELDARELELILDALREGRGRATDRATVALCLALGRNSNQYVRCVNGDLVRYPYPSIGPLAQNGKRHLYELRIPRQKKRGSRVEYRSWPLDERVGLMLDAVQRGGGKDPLLWWVHEESKGQPDLALNTILKRWARDARIISPRTRRPIVLNPRRFRVTLLTNAADEGASPMKLAELADHTDQQNVKVYVDNSPGYLVRLSDRVDQIYDPLVKRFAGKVASRADAKPGVTGRVIPGATPTLPVLDTGGIGVCGAGGPCHRNPVVSCYRCNKFVAWKEGRHEDVVVALERAMEQMSPRIALLLAPSLAAAREVVAAIQEETTLEAE